MKRGLAFVLTVLMPLILSVCGGVEPTNNSSCHAVPGSVAVASAGKTVAPLQNFLYSAELWKGGLLCADGRSLFHGYEEEHAKIEREAPELSYDGGIAVTISGRHGAADTASLFDKDFKQLDYSLKPDEKGRLELPDDAGIRYVCLVVMWTAEKAWPGQENKEYTGIEYIFKIAYHS